MASITVEEGNYNYDSRNNCNAIIDKNTNTLIAGCYTTIIPKSVLAIGDSSFCYANRLQNITIPERVTAIGRAAFMFCNSLEAIVLPEGLRTVGIDAFGWCRRLESVTLPSTLTSWGRTCFAGCERIKQVYSAITNPFEIDRYDFADNAYNTATLYVPNGSKTTYWRVAAWNRFENIVEYDPTGVSAATMDSNSAAPVYSLSGQRLAAPRKGVNIVGGKKVIMK